MFLWGGLTRRDATRRVRLESGDVVVWGGPAHWPPVAPLACDQAEAVLDGLAALRFGMPEIAS